MILKLIDFLHKTFGIGTDAVANIMVTVFTFSAGILITVIFKAISGYLERRNHRKLLKINLLNLMKGVFRQACSYDKFYKQIDVGHTGPFSFTPVSISAVGIFQQLGYKNIYNAFFNGVENIRFRRINENRIAFNNIWAALEYLNVFHQKSFTQLDKFIENNNRINEQRNSSLGKVHQIVENIRLTLHNEEIDKPLADYFNSIEQILLTLRSQQDFVNPQKTNELFIEPLLELNRDSIDVIKQYKAVLKPVELNSFLLETSLRYLHMKNLMEANHSLFKQYNNTFFTNFNKLKISYRVLFN